MIDGKFLRRIELSPSPDLASRRDLLLFQTVIPLSAVDWETLTQPKSAIDITAFREEHKRFVDWYTRHITETDVRRLLEILIPFECVNRNIYNLCLINRIRYELNYPLMTFNEEDWIHYVILRIEPTYRRQFQEYIIEHLQNG